MRDGRRRSTSGPRSSGMNNGFQSEMFIAGLPQLMETTALCLEFATIALIETPKMQELRNGQFR